MAYRIISGEYNEFDTINGFRPAVLAFVLDSANDVASLPKCSPGSTAMVAAKGGPIYMVNASGNWEEL